jgi:excisionase family DNA binding protein
MTAVPSADTTEIYLTIQETAQRLKVATAWVYKRTCSGQIPCRKFGRHVRIPLLELKKWEDDR